jgi:hypothetical protein
VTTIYRLYSLKKHDNGRCSKSLNMSCYIERVLLALKCLSKTFRNLLIYQPFVIRGVGILRGRQQGALFEENGIFLGVFLAK